MSTEQRDDNLGIDSDLRNRDPAAYDAALKARLQRLRWEMGCAATRRGFRPVSEPRGRVRTRLLWRSLRRVEVSKGAPNQALHLTRRACRLFVGHRSPRPQGR
jgi:hypothetical protein